VKRFFFLATLCLVGCAKPLPEVTDVREPRVLGVLVHVTDDPTRNTPVPGERVEVELVVADEAARRGRTYRFVVCLPADSLLDVGVCDTVLANGRFESNALPAVPEPPRFALDVPDEVTLGEHESLLVHGAVCADGALGDHIPLEVFPDELVNANPCADAANVGELVTFRIPIARTEADINHRPELVGTTLDGQLWDASVSADAPANGCASLDMPMLSQTEDDHALGFEIAPGSREIYLMGSSSREEVHFLALHSTAGDFPGQMAFFDGTDSSMARFRTLDDRSPSVVPDDGQLVRFTFVLRDGRGGAVVAERALCVVP
jgi:hypothetical protein